MQVIQGGAGMLDKRKSTREYLADTSRTEFYEVIKEAKLSPRQEGILEMKFVKDLTYIQIAFYFNVDVNTIKRDVKKAYDKVAKLLIK